MTLGAQPFHKMERSQHLLKKAYTSMRRGQACLWKVSTLFVEEVSPFCCLGWIMHIMPLVVAAVHMK